MPRARVVGKFIYLRPLEREDINDEYLNWMNDPVTIPYILGARFPVSLGDLEQYYDETRKSRDSVMFAVCDKETGVHIGNARLSHIDWINRTAVYGRLIGRAEHRRHGYGTDTLIQLLRYGFHQLGMNRLWAPVLALNEASLRSNDKVGMKREGVLREYAFVNGKFWDAVVFSMLRPEFDEMYGGPEKWDDASK